MPNTFNQWLDKYDDAKTMSQSDTDLLRQLMADGLDYEKYDLKPREVLFAVFYVFHTGNNAYKAAEKAGYSASICNIASMWIRGKRQKQHLVDFIADLVSSFGATKTQIVGYLTFVMQADFWSIAIDYQRDEITGETVKDKKGEPITFYNLEKVERAGLMPMIKSIRRQKGEIQHIEIHDGLKAAELLGQTHGMFKKHVEINDVSKAIKDAGISEEDYERLKTEKKEVAKQHLREKRLSQEAGQS